MKIDDVEKGLAVWMSVGGDDRLCVVLTNPEPGCDDDGTELGWKVVTYDVGTQVITEHNDCRRARDDDDLFYRRPQHSNPSLAAAIAALGEAMLNYADVAADRATRQARCEYEALRNEAASHVIRVHQDYNVMLRQLHAVLDVPTFVLSADAQCAAIRRILAYYEESGE
jgi:hypothetical protein